MKQLVVLILGGTAGTLARFWLSGAVYQWGGTGFPYGTLVVNLFGCWLIGLFTGLAEDKFLLSTVDAIFNESEFLSYLHCAENGVSVDGLLAVTRFVDDENPLYARIDEFNNILGLTDSKQSPWVTGGLYVFSPKIFNEVDAALKQRIERLRNFLRHLLKQGYSFQAFPFSKIVDVDHAHDIQTAEDLLRTR